MNLMPWPVTPPGIELHIEGLEGKINTVTSEEVASQGESVNSAGDAAGDSHQEHEDFHLCGDDWQ